MPRLATLAARLAPFPLLMLALGCASGGAHPSGPVVADTLCNLAKIELARCDAGAELDAKRCRAASDAVLVCAIGNSQVQGLVASTLRPGVGLTPRSLQTCWRTLPGGPQKFGSGRLDVDPFEVAGMPGAPQGALPCGIEAVNLAYKDAFGQVCLGEGAALGGYCGGPSNEALRTATPKLEWACRNRPDLLNSSGPSEWNCHPGGVDLLRLAAFVGGTQMLASIDAAMGNNPPPPPPPILCPNGRPDPGEDCHTCPADAGPCAPPPAPCTPPLECRERCPEPPAPVVTCVPLGLKQTACKSAGWVTPTARKDALRALCDWAKALPTC